MGLSDVYEWMNEWCMYDAKRVAYGHQPFNFYHGFLPGM